MNKKIGLILSVIAAGALMISGCGGGSSGGGTVVETPPAIVEQNNIVSINVVDTNDVALKNVSVAPIGTVLNIEGDAITETFTTDVTGIVSFYSKVGENIKILANLDGYISTGTEITVESGVNSKTIKLVKFEAGTVNDGVAMEQETVAVTAAGTTADIEVILTNETDNTTTEQNITIPAGTVMKTEDGTVVTGTVTISAANYTSEATESFPGGLTVLAAGVPIADGSDETADQDVDFLSAGFTAIQMQDEEGNIVKTFEDGNVSIAMTLPKDTINPETGNVVQIGDIIPIWSYEETTGEWSYEKDGTVASNPGDPDTFVVVYEASHLSYWNLDWYDYPRCTPARVNITDLAQGTDIITSLKIEAPGFSRTVWDYAGDGYYDLTNIAKTIPVTLSLMYNGVVKDTNTLTLGDACTADLSVGIDTIVPPTPVKVTIVEQCADGSNELPIPSVPSYLINGDSGISSFNDITDINGETIVPIPPTTADNRIYSYIYGTTRYTSYSNYHTIPAGTTTDQKIIYTLSSEYDEYCGVVPTGSDGGS